MKPSNCYESDTPRERSAFQQQGQRCILVERTIDAAECDVTCALHKSVQVPEKGFTTGGNEHIWSRAVEILLDNLDVIALDNMT